MHECQVKITVRCLSDGDFTWCRYGKKRAVSDKCVYWENNTCKNLSVVNEEIDAEREKYRITYYRVL